MGAWGSGSFENDTAYDWIRELERQTAEDAPDFLREALSAVADAPDGEYIDSDEGSAALAAAEVVAAALGRPATAPVQEFVGTDPVEGLPGGVRTWLAAHPFTPPKDLIDLARRAVRRARSDGSELKELWDDAGDESWARVVDDLEQRLSR